MLTEQDQIILDLKANLRLKAMVPVFLECSTAIDSERVFHVICGEPSVAGAVMDTPNLLEQVWIVTGCLKVSVWIFNHCFWEAEYSPGKPQSKQGLELLSDELIPPPISPMPATSTISSTIQGAIAPALDNLIDQEIERYLSGDEIKVYIQNRLLLKLNGLVSVAEPAAKPEDVTPAAVVETPKAKKPRAKAVAEQSDTTPTGRPKRKPATRRKPA